ncbi:MAG TPA: hypothetical protein VEB64_10785 [Azospirillaceae bacterium]|nr:hypothetical protein [Azospirillaceae bacterium]
MAAMAAGTERHPWLERFVDAPPQELDDLLSGLADIAPFERASASDALVRLFGDCDPRGAERRLLDETLAAWLQSRRRASASWRREYGLPRFVTEYCEGLAAIWRLDLPQSAAWLQASFLDLLRWAEPLFLSTAWDLPGHLTRAAALTQTDRRHRLPWYRLCADAVRPSQRHLLDPALLGLDNLPPEKAGQQRPNKELVNGLARWARELPEQPKEQGEFLRRWRAIKARYPRTASTWYGCWGGILEDKRNVDAPFRQWLLQNDPGLGRKPARAEAPPEIPWDIPDQVKGMRQRARKGLSKVLLDEMVQLLGTLERYANATGDAYYFVRSACSLGASIARQASGHALILARDALVWEPGNGHAWDLRGRALTHLGRADLAELVYWEAVRRVPSDPVVRNQLAILLQQRPDRVAEAEGLFREVMALGLHNAPSRVELARLMARQGRMGEAEDLLRRTMDDIPDHAITPYMLGLILIAAGRPEDAAAVCQLYIRRFRENGWSATLKRLIAAGEVGVAEARSRLGTLKSDEDEEIVVADEVVALDAPKAAAGLAGEDAGQEELRRVGLVSEADFRLDLGGEAERQGRDALNRALSTDDGDNILAHVVLALHDEDHRRDLRAAVGEHPHSLPLQLAVTDVSTDAASWDRMVRIFPEQAVVIDLARVVRGESRDERSLGRLERWTVDAVPEKGSFEAFLQGHIKSRLLDTRFEAEAVKAFRPVVAKSIKRLVDVDALVLPRAVGQ